MMRNALDIGVVAVCVLIVVLAAGPTGVDLGSARRMLIIVSCGFVAVRRTLALIDRWGT
jgi:hypothetical protein